MGGSESFQPATSAPLRTFTHHETAPARDPGSCFREVSSLTLFQTHKYTQPSDPRPQAARPMRPSDPGPQAPGSVSPTCPCVLTDTLAPHPCTSGPAVSPVSPSTSPPGPPRLLTRGACGRRRSQACGDSRLRARAAGGSPVQPGSALPSSAAAFPASLPHPRSPLGLDPSWSPREPEPPRAGLGAVVAPGLGEVPPPRDTQHLSL